jgi:hypothetical protein
MMGSGVRIPLAAPINTLILFMSFDRGACHNLPEKLMGARRGRKHRGCLIGRWHARPAARRTLSVDGGATERIPEKSVSLYIVVDESAKGTFNWTTASANYGEAGPMLCDEALRRVVKQLQGQYDAIDG